MTSDCGRRRPRLEVVPNRIRAASVILPSCRSSASSRTCSMGVVMRDTFPDFSIQSERKRSSAGISRSVTFAPRQISELKSGPASKRMRLSSSCVIGRNVSPARIQYAPSTSIGIPIGRGGTLKIRTRPTGSRNSSHSILRRSRSTRPAMVLAVSTKAAVPTTFLGFLSETPRMILPPPSFASAAQYFTSLSKWKFALASLNSRRSLSDSASHSFRTLREYQDASFSHLASRQAEFASSARGSYPVASKRTAPDNQVYRQVSSQAAGLHIQDVGRRNAYQPPNDLPRSGLPGSLP